MCARCRSRRRLRCAAGLRDGRHRPHRRWTTRMVKRSAPARRGHPPRHAEGLSRCASPSSGAATWAWWPGPAWPRPATTSSAPTSTRRKIARLQAERHPDLRARPGADGPRATRPRGGSRSRPTSARRSSAARVVFIAVGTPPGEDGSADLQHVLDVARLIGRHMNAPKVVVTKSTVPVGHGGEGAGGDPERDGEPLLRLLQSRVPEGRAPRSRTS